MPVPPRLAYVPPALDVGIQDKRPFFDTFARADPGLGSRRARAIPTTEVVCGTTPRVVRRARLFSTFSVVNQGNHPVAALPAEVDRVAFETETDRGLGGSG
jgi:hypothetical protein